MKTILLAALLGATGLAFGATPKPNAGAIDPAARAFADSVGARLGAASTIRLTAKHRLDPRLGVGQKLEQGPLQITVQRPNRFHVFQPAGEQTREIAFDGRAVCVMHPGMKHHALEPLRARSIDEFSDVLDRRFGFRPPVAELLGQDLGATLFRDAASARVVGFDRIGWTRCERLQIVQQGMTTDLWVGAKDRLPRRLVITFIDEPGKPAWEIKFSRWELNVPVDAALFSKRPAPDSFRVKMLRTP